MKKLLRITSALESLSEGVGQALTTVDFWDADLCSIGIINPAVAGRLVYLSIANQPEGRFYLELEEGDIISGTTKIVSRLGISTK